MQPRGSALTLQLVCQWPSHRSCRVDAGVAGVFGPLYDMEEACYDKTWEQYRVPDY